MCLQVNMLMSNKGTVLRCDVNGKIVMKVFLSGMPDVKLGLNDKLEVGCLCATNVSGRKMSEIKNVTNHKCDKSELPDKNKNVRQICLWRSSAVFFHSCTMAKSQHGTT